MAQGRGARDREPAVLARRQAPLLLRRRRHHPGDGEVHRGGDLAVRDPVGRRPRPHQPRPGAATSTIRPGSSPACSRCRTRCRSGASWASARSTSTARKIDFRPIGPAEQVSFAQAPDHKRAYGIKQRHRPLRVLDVRPRERQGHQPHEVQGPAARGAARELERQDHLRLHRRRRRIDLYDAATLQVPADHLTWAPIRRPNSSSCPVPPPPAPAEGVVTSQPAADANLRRAFAYLAPYWRRLVLVMAISLVSTGVVARHPVPHPRTSSTARSSAATWPRCSASCCCSRCSACSATG